MSNALTNDDYDRIITLVGLLAEDVWDEHPISVLIRSACTSESQTERVTLSLANAYGFAETDGSYATDEYLDSLGWFHGMTHQRFIETLRTVLRENHPSTAEHDYGAARRRRAEPDTYARTYGI